MHRFQNIFYFEAIILTLLYSVIFNKAFQLNLFSARRSRSCNIIHKRIEFEYRYPTLLDFSDRFYSRIVLRSSNNLVSSEIQIDLENMKLVDLKVLLKKLGKTPGNLRKSEIIVECRNYMSTISVSSKSLTNNPLVINNSTRLYSTTTTDSINASTGDLPSSDYSNKQSKNTNATKDRNPNAASKGNSNSSNTTRLKTRTSLPPISPGGNVFSSSVGIPVNITDGRFMELSSSSSRNNKDDSTTRVGGGGLRIPFESIREKRIAEDVGNSEIDLTFLGTASCMPTVTRGVSCLAMRYKSDVWLFDCGESSQVQLQNSRIRPSRITKIFISHTHGDHSFGLPGVLCLIGQSRAGEDYVQPGDSYGDAIFNEPIDIYGPEGIRDLVRGVVQMSYSKIAVPHRIHELKDIPFLHDQFMRPPPTPVIRTRLDSTYGERSGGRDIYPDEKGCYELYQDEIFTVTAAPMQHTIPCVGYVVKENDRPGALKIDSLLPIVEANKDALSKRMPMYLKVLSHLKELTNGESYIFPDGTIVRPEDYLDSPKLGRKIVIMGDTCSGNHIIPLAMDADVLVHEATNAYLGLIIITTMIFICILYILLYIIYINIHVLMVSIYTYLSLFLYVE